MLRAVILAPARLVLALLAALAACAAPPADLVLRGGRIRTQDRAHPLAEALAVRDGRLVAVGSDANVAALVGPHTRVVELQGRTALPGLFDAHLHLAGLAEGERRADLVGTASEAEVVARVAAHAAHLAPGAWVLGRGWDQNDWADTAFPTHAALSAALPDRPAALWRVDGHALLANAAALALAGVTEDTPDPPGGRILRDAGGRPSGVLVDNAMTLVETHVPPLSAAELRDALPRVVAGLHRLGITAVADAGVPLSRARAYAELAREGRLELRVHVMLDADDPAVWTDSPGLPARNLDGRGRVSVRAVKAYADGALGSRGAALLAPYADDPTQSGLLLTPPERFAALAERCLRAGWQLCTHAIGDRANRLVLDAYAAALAAVPPLERAVPDPRLRIEHAQVLDPADVPRFGQLGVVASMQALHQSSDCPWAGARLGAERERYAYAWRALLDAGALLCGGSDAPVESPDPLLALHAFVARPDPGGRSPGGWHTEQALTREEALAALTTWAAQACFEESRLGRLVPGMAADVVVLSGDPLEVPVEALPDLRVDLTVFDGRVVHERATSP
jgi:predicted amidohydrolase YtcJ